MSAPRTARSRARLELTLEIKDAARRQLAVDGADRLSLRAVARELEMAPSALYRYFASRDDLLTALIIDSYDAVGDQAEQAIVELPTADILGHWLAVCRAVRTWAVDHPHEFALIYGSPLPGYRAPSDTIAPASRVYLLLLGLVRDAHHAGRLAPAPGGPPLPSALRKDSKRMLAALDLKGLPPIVLTRAITAWTQVIGAISLELFGHLQGGFDDNAALFEHTVRLMADLVGFEHGSAR